MVGDGWGSCRACGAAQPVEGTTVGRSTAEKPAAGPTDFWGRAFQGLGIDGGDPSVATYLYVIGGACLLVGVIYFLATAGFPPHTTTTFEYGPDGSVTESTSPGTVQFLVCLGLVVVGAILVRAGRAASAESRK